MPVRKLSNDSDCTPLPSLVLTQKNISKVNVEISNEVEELPETNTIQLQAIYH